MKKTILISGILTGTVRSGNRFMTFVMFGVAAGVSCAFLRYPFLPLLPIAALLAAGAALMGILLAVIQE